MRLLQLFPTLALLLLLLGCVPANQPPEGQLAPITANAQRLMAGRAVFELRGINYIHTNDADLTVCPAIQFGADANCPWNIAPIIADLDLLQSLGVNTIRVFLNYYVFGGAQATNPEYRMDTALQHLDTLIEEANRRGIYVMPVLLAKYPQDRFRPEDYATALDLHVRPVVKHLAGRNGILAWDLFNEPDLGGPVYPECWDWDNGDFPACSPLANERLHFIRMLHDEVKRLDPARLTTVSLGFAKNYFRPIHADLRLADVVDFLTFHYYDNDPYDSGRYEAHWYYGKGFPDDLRNAIRELDALGLNKPIAVTEIGFPTGEGTLRQEAELHRDLQVSLQVVRDERISGMLLWPFQPKIDDLVGNLFRP
jgi:endo-1,4-beta-mannosidase